MPRELREHEKWAGENCYHCGGRLIVSHGVALMCENVKWAIDCGEPIVSPGFASDTPCKNVLLSG